MALLPRSIPNPLRWLGLARILGGFWFVVTGVMTLRQYHDLLPQAERLFGPDSGTTGAPTRALITLVAAVVLVLIGLVLIAKGMSWLSRVPLPPDGPNPVPRDEVLAVLRDRQLLAYEGGHVTPLWVLRRWLADELAEMTWWRRDITSRGVRALARASGFCLVLTVVCLVLPRMMPEDVLGPFPLAFVITLPFVTGLWAVFGMLLIGSIGPRVDLVEVPFAADSEQGSGVQGEQIIESAPVMLGRDAPGIGLTLGITGVAVQCLMLTWWELSPIDYPLQATTILRYAGAIFGGVVFFVVGGRMVASAAKLLQLFQYESILTLIDTGRVARAAAVRTQSLGLEGPRHVISAVGGTHVREATERLLREATIDGGFSA